MTTVTLQLFSLGIQFLHSSFPQAEWRERVVPPRALADHALLDRALMDHGLMDQRPSSAVAARGGVDT